MACNCATKEEIEAIYAKYGEKVAIKKSQSIKFRIKNDITKIIVGIILIPVAFFLIPYVLIHGTRRNKEISVKKLFGLGNGKKQIISY